MALLTLVENYFWFARGSVKIEHSKADLRRSLQRSRDKSILDERMGD
jgi:hypothetical protein